MYVSFYFTYECTLISGYSKIIIAFKPNHIYTHTGAALKWAIVRTAQG